MTWRYVEMLEIFLNNVRVSFCDQKTFLMWKCLQLPLLIINQN